MDNPTNTRRGRLGLATLALARMLSHPPRLRITKNNSETYCGGSPAPAPPRAPFGRGIGRVCPQRRRLALFWASSRRFGYAVASPKLRSSFGSPSFVRSPPSLRVAVVSGFWAACWLGLRPRYYSVERKKLARAGSPLRAVSTLASCFVRWPSCRVRSSPPTAAPRPKFRCAPLGAPLSLPPFGLLSTHFASVPSALRWLATPALVNPAAAPALRIRRNRWVRLRTDTYCGGSPAPAPPRPRPLTLAPPSWLASLRFTCGGYASGLAVGASALTDGTKGGYRWRLMAPWGGVLAAARFHRSWGIYLSALPCGLILWRRLVRALRSRHRLSRCPAGASAPDAPL